MKSEKKRPRSSGLSETKKNIIQLLLQEYEIDDVHNIQNASKDLLGDTIKGMLEAEMKEHLGYEKSARSDNSNSRNGYKTKQIQSNLGVMEIQVPQDRESTYEPKIVKKRQKDISEIDCKIISIYYKKQWLELFK